MKLRNSKAKLFCETSFKNDTSGTNRVTGDHKGDAPFLCDRWDSKHTWSLVTLSFLLQNVETVNRVTSDQCPGPSDPTYKDAEFPYRSSPQMTVMYWNLGNWCRNRFDKCPVPERFQKFIPHIDYTIDEDHEKLMRTKHSSTITSSTSLRTLEDIFS